MWNSRTVAVYMEDGNEMNNTISYNVGICARDDHCAARGLHWQDAGEGGIYGYGEVKFDKNVTKNASETR